jgi:signal transduction histidine kinase
MGIEPAMLSRVFGMFVQVDAALPRADGGRGIGLAVVRDLVELHGGTVKAVSAGPGLGSEFTVALPMMWAQLDPLVSTAP